MAVIRNQIKSLIKEAVMELVSEQREEIHSLLVEVLEDAVMVSAIEEGLSTPRLNPEEMNSWVEQLC